ncbi:MAG: sugar ABC transporter permease [Clostridia bacterium]|nr:sugar ABC transporter permease [Clostridia bacterium]
MSLKTSKQRLEGEPWFWLFLGPCLIALAVVVAVPTVIGLFYSFTTWDGINEMKMTGLENFKGLFKDKLFWQSFGFTGLYAIVAVILINMTGLALAMLVTAKFVGKNALRTTLYIPNLIGGLILGYIWSFIFTDAFSTLGSVLHIKWLQGWLSNTQTGFWGLVILSVWQMAGYMMVIYIAYLENVPEDLLEAARIDGANKSQVFRHIIIPMIAPAFTVNTFLTLSNSFKLFDQNLALTNGAPGNTTQMLALNIYRTAFAENKMAYAQAKALVFFIIVGVISLAQVYFSKKREVEV